MLMFIKYLMSCINCDKQVENSKYQLCKNCGYDKKVTITLTDVKRKYLLTESELSNANLKFFEVKTKKMGVKGKIYIRSHVHELAKKLCSELNETDKRKIYYEREEKQITDYNEQKKSELDRHKEIKDYVIELLAKYNIPLDDTEILKHIDIYIKKNAQNDHNHFTISSETVKNICTYYKRKTELDILISQNIKSEYIDFAKKISGYYKSYTSDLDDSDLLLDVKPEDVFKYINKKVKIKMREDEVTKLINNPIYEPYKYNTKFRNLCNSYINNGGNVNITYELQSLTEQFKREKIINQIIDKNKNKNILITYESVFNKDLIKTYIEKGEGPIEDLESYIIKYIKKQEKSIKYHNMIKLHDWLISNNIKIQDVKHLNAYKQCVNGEVCDCFFYCEKK